MRKVTTLLMKKQQKKVQEMLDNLGLGDSVVTIGGMHGIIDEIDEENKTIVLDCEGIYLTFERSSVSRITQKASDTVAADAEDLGTNEPDTDEEAVIED